MSALPRAALFNQNGQEEQINFRFDDEPRLRYEQPESSEQQHQQGTITRYPQNEQGRGPTYNQLARDQRERLDSNYPLVWYRQFVRDNLMEPNETVDDYFERAMRSLSRRAMRRF